MSGIQWEPSPGDTVGNRYEITEFVGEGGFSVVWKAIDTRTDDHVVLKHPNPDTPKAWSDVQKYFHREVEALRILEEYGGHPNIMSLRDRVEENNLEFMTVDYIDGELLEDVGQTDADRVVEIGEQLCSVFAFLHVHEIVYRDLKPDNAMITTDGEVVLIDFNTARSRPKCRNCGHVMQFGEIDVDSCPQCGIDFDSATRIEAGMNKYKPPEMVRAEFAHRQGPWSDVYSIGKILYKLICGYVTPKPLEDPRDDDPECPNYLGDIVVKATSRQPARRYRNASMMGQAIRQADPDPEVPRAIIRNSDSNTEYSIVPGDTIGRKNASGPFASIELDDPTPENVISRVHAKFDYQNGQWILTDRSKNGTAVKKGGGDWIGIIHPHSWDGSLGETPPQHTILSEGDEIAIPRPDNGVTLEFSPDES